MRNLASSLFFIAGYVEGVIEAKAAPTATILQLVLFTILFFIFWDAVEWLEK